MTAKRKSKKTVLTVPLQEPNKAMITLRLRPSTLDFYRRTGRGWQTRLSDDLDNLVWQRVRAEWLAQPLAKTDLQQIVERKK